MSQEEQPKHHTAKFDSSEVTSMLQSAASHFSSPAPLSAPTSTNELFIRRSNDEGVLQSLEEVLKMHFHPLNLCTLPSVVVYLLLNYLVLKRESKEMESAKKLYEDHIALLKEKNAELEERVRETTSAVKPTTEPKPCKSCEELIKTREALSYQNAKLKQSYDELCHINEQWALDYEALTRYISNTTGLHSITSPSPSSSANSTSCSSSSSSSSARPTTKPASSSCIRCSIYESQLEDKQQEVDGLRASIVGLREDVKELKERLGLKQRELSGLENEYQIVRLQIQEIGDMQQTLNMKQDYRKMQRSLQHKTKQYQDAVCEKLELQKQIEKLRQAFLKFFPGSVSQQQQQQQQHGNPATRPPPPHSGGYYSFPMHSCRHNLQNHPATEPGPPTPPGLLARGDFRGAFAEKDDHQIPAIRLEERPMTQQSLSGHASSSSASPRISYSNESGSHSGDHYHHDNVSSSSSIASHPLYADYGNSRHHGNGDPAHHHHHHHYHPRMTNNNGQQQQQQQQQQHRSLSSSSISPNSNNGSSHPPLSTISSSSAFSSLGYASDSSGPSPSSLITHSSPNLMQCFAPSSSRSKVVAGGNHHNNNTTSSGNGGSFGMMPLSSLSLENTDDCGCGVAGNNLPRMQKSRSHEEADSKTAASASLRASYSGGGRSQSRPTSLILPRTSGGGGVGGGVGVASSQVVMQFFSCPNCKKNFSSGGASGNGFEPWFEHIKVCATTAKTAATLSSASHN